MARVIARSQVKTQTAAAQTAIWRVALAVGLLAGVGLAFQVALTRIFSLIFQYHFVFLVVSLGVMGLGLGAAAGYAALRTHLTDSGTLTLTRGLMALAVILPLAAWLLTTVNSSDQVVFAALVALSPFLLIGWINALVYARYAAESHVIYGADLIGAALGPVIALALLVLLGPFGAVLALGILAAGAALCLLPGRAVIVALVIVTALTIGNRAANFITYDATRIAHAPPDKTLVHVLNNPRLNAEVMLTAWGPFAQVDVVQTSDPDARFVFTDAGAGSLMLRYDPAAAQSFSWLDREVASLPFEAGPVTKTLVIGAGAGYDVLLARRAGAAHVTAVEVNPVIVEVTRQQADYNGDIYDLPEVETVITDGRNFADRTTEHYDLIYLNVVYSQAAAPGSSALVENHIFTVEALRAYWSRLNDAGRVAFVLHNGLEGVRALMTALAALQAEGLDTPDALAHTALVMSANAPDPTTAPAVLVISRQPWTADVAQAFSLAAARRGMQPLFIPHRAEDTLRMLRDGSMTLDAYIAANSEYNIFPTTDDRPFFYHLDHGLPAALNRLLLWSGLLALGYFIAAAALQPANPRHEWTRVSLVVYFGLLGAGFLMAEVVLLQRFSLLLGDPILSLVVTLMALLLGGGLGSIYGRRYTSAALPRVITLATAGSSAWLLLSLALYPAVIALALPAPLVLRVLVTAGLLLPLGFLMGMPFPAGLRLAHEADPDGVPLFWGINAVTSTLGGVLATVIALLAGFQAVMVIAALLYGGAGLLVRLGWRRVGLI